MTSRHTQTKNSAPLTYKISEVVELTGLSKELIHHYLRQGLLPRSSARARYEGVQIRLLHLIKKLREEHHLPLEDIRNIFEIFHFQPGSLEPMVLGESLSHRLSRFARNRNLGPARVLSADELVAEVDISSERLAHFIKLGLIKPLLARDQGPHTFTSHDAAIIALVERGTGLGIPFESFRTIASFVRVAFELEQGVFFDIRNNGNSSGPRDFAGQLFLRREVVGSFIHSLLHALTLQHMQEATPKRPPSATVLDGVVYKPSQDFVERHRIQQLTDELQERLGTEPDNTPLWMQIADLYLHGGRYGEAAFLLEQALERWPDSAHHPVILRQYGLTLALAGDVKRARDRLQSQGVPTDPLTKIYQALAIYAGASESSPLGPDQAMDIHKLVEEALDANSDQVVEVKMLGGWLLTTLPRPLYSGGRGQRLLCQVFERARQSKPSHYRLPGMRERLLINAAFLLFCCHTQGSLSQGECSVPPKEELRALICGLDPSSAFARQVFLDQAAPGDTP